MEPNNATSTATSTPNESGPSGLLPNGTLPLIGASILGIELKRFKRRTSLGALLASLPLLSIFGFYFAFGVDIVRKSGLEKIWERYVGSDDLLLLTIIIPLIILSFSLLHYKSRETVYKAWLGYSIIGLLGFVIVAIWSVVDSSRWFGPEILFIPLGIAYISGSILIWLYGFVTRKRYSK